MSKEQQLNDLFARAASAPASVSFEQTKDKFLQSLGTGGTVSLSSKLKALFNLKNGMIMLSIASIIGISIWMFVGNEPGNSLTKSESIDVKENILQQEKQSVEPSQNQQSVARIKKKKQEINFNLPVASITIQQFEDNMRAGIQLPPLKQLKDNVALPERVYFPKLTEDEIAANYKQKKKMIKALTKLDNKTYSYIPAGSFDYNGQKVSVQSYFMQQNEVSNLEYRTFLFDLLIQGRKDEFLIAQPDQTQWSTLTAPDKNPYEDYYFSHPAYDNYPVVNISRKGAEMYCEWLTKEANATLKESEKINDLRIPTRIEWVKAASNEGKQLPYAWNEPLTRNSEGIYLANYKMSAEEYAQLDTTLSVDMKANASDIIAPVRSYFPNAYGLYNMCGNVAEMVYNSKINEMGLQMVWDGNGTAGGSWMNTVEEIKIYGPDSYDDVIDAHPAIGFRVVMTHLSKRVGTPTE